MEDVDFMTRTPSLPQFPIWQCEKTGKIIPRVIDFGSEVAIAILARALKVKIDERTMYGKFNITKLGRQDQILLGIPWLRAINSVIDWAEETLTLP